jgi:surface polysaccharide O-acyltransferase-like enzyme
VLVIAQPYIQNNWLLTNYGSVLVAAQSVALFLLLYRADIKNNAARRILPLISSVTLEIYLFSYLADSTVYPYLYQLSGGITQQEFYLRYFVVAVPAVFVSSLATALLLHIAYTRAAKLLKRIFKRPEKIPAVGRR